MKAPQDMDSALIARAKACLEIGDARGAYDLAQQIVQRKKLSIPARMILGRIAADHGNWRAAERLFAEAATLSNGSASRAVARVQQARCLVAINRQEEARMIADEAEALLADGHPDPLTLDTLGVVRSRTGDLTAALRLFESATGARPDIAAFHYNLALARQFNGDLDGAKSAYETVLALEPTHPKALAAIVSLARQTTDNHRLGILIPMFRDDDPDPARQQQLGHAIAKTLEDMDDPVTALDWLARAKSGRRGQVGSPIAADRALFDAARATVTGKASDLDNDRPVFIVGLPRSGTTLIDRILSSHRDIASLGELGDFSIAVKRLSGTSSDRVMDVETLGAARDLDRRALGSDYLQRLSGHPLAGNQRRLIDKMPLNVLYSGLIHEALPQARIICLRRHPVDSALANYRQLFATDFPYYDHTLDLADAGRYYALFDGLVDHWRTVLPPDRFTEVHYEAVVDDLEGQARRLIAFLGLEWNPACMDFHLNAAPVSTASSVQVRAPLHNRSVGRWKRYGEGLKPLLDALDAAGIAY
jgi:tetratricopeptide (TPR) repeat protein